MYRFWLLSFYVLNKSEKWLKVIISRENKKGGIKKMKQMKNKKERGITLIALVVTIIVLIILAGISINLIFGTNGIINKAKLSKTLTEQASLNEQIALGKLDKELEEYLPENTKDNPQDIGTIVKVPDKWATQTVKYIKTSDGLETTELTKVATVYAVSVGGGETVPVPNEFYYVGGNLDTGVIISDNQEDKYDGKVDKTTYEYTTNLKGNQFVWIPCETNEYKKCDTWNGVKQTNGTLASSVLDTKTLKSELIQIEKYGGFYVGRYEAGLANTITEFKEGQIDSTPIYNKEGIPQSKAGVIPWMFIDWQHAKVNAESMYNNDKYKNYVSSGLITDTQWDVMLKKMLGKTIGETNGKNEIKLTEADLINSSNWGNYRNNSVTYTGRLAKSVISNRWILEPFGNNISGVTTNDIGELLTTGASKIAQVYHIYDVAGSLWETTDNCTWRGGSYKDFSNEYPVCYYGIGETDQNTMAGGFRTVLYIK